MVATLERPGMAKKRGRPKTGRDETVVKLDRGLAGKVKAIATHRGIPVGELLAEMFEGPINKAYAQMLRELEGK